MEDLQLHNYIDDSQDYVYFEPRPVDKIDENTLEGCLYHASRFEKLIDKNNLYHCELCTKEKYGQSKIKQNSIKYFRIEEEAQNSSLETLHLNGSPSQQSDDKLEKIFPIRFFLHEEQQQDSLSYDTKYG